jgi:hypothetical protein
MFVEEPTVGKLLATRGGSIDVNALAKILNREAPSMDEIKLACANMYPYLTIITTAHHYMMMIGLKKTNWLRVTLKSGK